MLGAVIGVVAGACGFYALYRFTGAITTQGRVNVLWALVFVLLPPVLLVAMALLRREELLPAAIGLSGTLLVCAVAFFAVRMVQNKRQEKEKRNEGSDQR